MALSRKSKIIIGAAAAVVILIVIIASIFATRTDTPEVTVVKVETRKELRSTVTSSGEVRPIQFQNVTSEVQGRIEEIYVKEGDQVTKGQPLVRLDPADARLQGLLGRPLTDDAGHAGALALLRAPPAGDAARVGGHPGLHSSCS